MWTVTPSTLYQLYTPARQHLSLLILWQLHWLLVRQWVQFKYAGYCRWQPYSALCWQSNVLGQEIMQPVQWPLFCHCRATGHHRWKRLCLVSWAAAPCVRTLRALTRNLLTYLPTYLRSLSWSSSVNPAIHRRISQTTVSSSLPSACADVARPTR